jgi:hypothetical protein
LSFLIIIVSPIRSSKKTYERFLDEKVYNLNSYTTQLNAHLDLPSRKVFLFLSFYHALPS